MTTESIDRVALAFSGGLDTTVCVPLLKDQYGYDEVIAVTVDVGQPDAELDDAIETAAVLGVEHEIVDATDAFAASCLDAVKANAQYQGYPLGTALARPIIAETVVDVADEYECTALAHGCTGKGNDQLRFEAVWRATEYDVIAPVRDLGLTRAWELEYADDHDLPVDGGNDGVWSIDTNLWSRSVEGGDLEDPATVPSDDIYEWTSAPGSAVEYVDIGFVDGVPETLDGDAYSPVALIEALNELAGSYGVGRTDLMEDRLLGLKVRENYEHPAATTLLAAHAGLEGLVLTKAERSMKTQIDAAWAEKAYEGRLSAPVVAALDSFIETTQTRVTGSVTVKFEGGQARVVGRESEYATYSEAGASFDTEAVIDGITQADATGVAKYHGFQDRLATTHAGQSAAPDGGNTHSGE